jgi:hypothetical protein
MASLSAHLRQTGDHGRLGFHANCPVCREERLFGTLSSDGVVSRRTQAALATGAMAFSLATSSPVWAQEPDSRQEGTVAPQEPNQGRDGDVPDGSEAPGVDSGAETVLPVEVGPPQGAPQEGTDDAEDGANYAEGENAPLETEPEVDPDIGLVPLTEPEATEPSPGDEDAAPPVAPAPAPPADETSPPATGTPEAPSAERKHPRRNSAKKRTGASARPEQHRRQQRAQNQRSTAPAIAPTTTAPVQPTATVAQAPTVEVAAPGQGDAAPASLRPGSRYHVVRPGESLWAIARGVLPPDASMARIAREVTHLWDLNEERIATGDPDLLKIGTKLRLR